MRVPAVILTSALSVSAAPLPLSVAFRTKILPSVIRAVRGLSKLFARELARLRNKRRADGHGKINQ